MTNEPHELLETVIDEISFLKFVEALRQDRQAEVTDQQTTSN